jgi:hypothetical protein
MPGIWMSPFYLLPNPVYKSAPMPTPFMHLDVAERMRAQAIAQAGADGRLPHLLAAEWPAFYLGSVAPDYQSICDVPRAETHFHRTPPEPDQPAHARMLTRYPALADAAALPPAQAVFVAAYRAHLLLDLVWFHDIVTPYFLSAVGLGDVPQRYLRHNILLTHLDKLAYDALPSHAAATLAAARPDRWLPFADDALLRRWRDLLVDQLRPDGLLQTVTIYAGRLRMAPDEFGANLDDPQWMAQQVFARIPVEAIQARLATAVAESLTLVADYLHPLLVAAPEAAGVR